MPLTLLLCSCANPKPASTNYYGTTQSIHEVADTLEGQMLSSEEETKLRASSFETIYTKLFAQASAEPIFLDSLTLPSTEEQLAEAQGAYEDLDHRFASFGEFLDEKVGDSRLTFATEAVIAILDPAARAQRKAAGASSATTSKKTKLTEDTEDSCYTQGEAKKQQTVGYCIGRALSARGVQISLAQSMCASVSAGGIQDAAADAACVPAPAGALCEVDVNGTMRTGTTTDECNSLNQFSGQARAQRR